MIFMFHANLKTVTFQFSVHEAIYWGGGKGSDKRHCFKEADPWVTFPETVIQSLTFGLKLRNKLGICDFNKHCS